MPITVGPVTVIAFLGIFGNWTGLPLIALLSPNLQKGPLAGVSVLIPSHILFGRNTWKIRFDFAVR
jgi:hypothetical protein